MTKDNENKSRYAGRKRVTASDIAKVLGINQSTVSRAFSNKSVSPKKRELILQTAQKLGYRPNGIARGLITGKSKMIGLITSDIKNPFYPDIIERFTNLLREKGYYVLFVNSLQGDIGSDDIAPFMEYEMEGIISVAAHLSSSIVTRLKDSGFPVVLFNRYIGNSGCSAVSCDNIQGGQMVADLFVKTMHQRLAFVSGSPDTSTSRDREKGFKQRLSQYSYPDPRVICGYYTYEGGYNAAMQLLRSDSPPNGVFCSNDIMALGFLDAARHLGVRVPDEVSVVGFDDIPLAAWKAYSLTTVRQPVNKMVNVAIGKLLQEIKGLSSEPSIDFIQGELILRDTVKDYSKT